MEGNGLPTKPTDLVFPGCEREEQRKGLWVGEGKAPNGDWKRSISRAFLHPQRPLWRTRGDSELLFIRKGVTEDRAGPALGFEAGGSGFGPCERGPRALRLL